ncbi:MAG: ferredoxin, partial [Oscillospiraceae bacterium]|nr:ferredoxin [Oscillospiraceae bacterium]
LIRVRFPELIEHVLPLVSPMELAARMAKADAVRKTGLPEEQIGCIFLSPCPAKVTATKMPIGSSKSSVDAAIAIKEIYPRLLSAMKRADNVDYLSTSGRIGLGWGESGGECAGLVSTDSYLAADGIENVIRVLEDLEDKKFPDLEFVELNACAGGCVGGVLQVENPYISKAKIKKLRRYIPVSKNHLTGSIPPEMLWDTDLVYEPVMELGQNKHESFARYAQMETILQSLPGLDCGSCGAPSCQSLAEDVVRGKAEVEDCVVLMRQRMEAVLAALGKGT